MGKTKFTYLLNNKKQELFSWEKKNTDDNELPQNQNSKEKKLHISNLLFDNLSNNKIWWNLFVKIILCLRYVFFFFANLNQQTNFNQQYCTQNLNNSSILSIDNTFTIHCESGDRLRCKCLLASNGNSAFAERDF